MPDENVCLGYAGRFCVENVSINPSKTPIQPARFIIATARGAHAHGKDRTLAKQVPRTT